MKAFLPLLLLFYVTATFAQDTKLLLKEASNEEKNLNESAAFDKYRAVVAIDSNNIEALIHLSAISLARGIRSSDKKEKDNQFQQSLQFANRAVSADETNSDAQTAASLANQYLASVANNNKVMADYLKTAIGEAEKGFALNKENGYAAYALGHLHFQLVQLPGVKRSILNNIYTENFKGNIDSAIYYFERSRSLLPYFVRNHLELAKAYNYNNEPAKVIEILNKLIKLPNRTVDDKALKSEGERLLKSML